MIRLLWHAICDWMIGWHQARQCIHADAADKWSARLTPDWCPNCGVYRGHAHPDCPGAKQGW